MTKELLQHFTNDLWTKIKSLFLLKEEAVDGILVKQGWQVVESVTANNTIALPSLDSFDELCIEMYDSDGVVVHNTTLRCETLLSENTNSEYREILLDNIHNLQTYVTYNMADNTIIPSYYEGVVIDSTSTVITVVYIKGSELVSTVKSSVIAYDGTESGLEATNVQDAIDEIRVKVNPNVQDVSGVIAKTDAHIANMDNPHGVTASQIGIDNSVSGMNASNVQGAIDKLNTNVADVQTQIDNIGQIIADEAFTVTVKASVINTLKSYTNLPKGVYLASISNLGVADSHISNSIVKNNIELACNCSFSNTTHVSPKASSTAIINIENTTDTIYFTYFSGVDMTDRSGQYIQIVRIA